MAHAKRLSRGSSAQMPSLTVATGSSSFIRYTSGEVVFFRARCKACTVRLRGVISVAWRATTTMVG
ncbi:hypothetical protein C9397_15460 [Xanthomonas vasicola pv. vasculorum]|uniref:Uncharacterized protein n=2 Tax=Xanthomonas vasicola TaxID=56459 RepID=A0AAE8F4G8_XANVA|nr:hypothetical protein C7V42_07930 [Xanthomonas vasicola pv. vasculorum]AZR26169.1 hypothetical protein NX80_006330 [Xanthomonas vasicola pv. arecae]AZR31550.1 hypothetical protein KWO_014500 [Xanthomonas vasicola pv. musacearum NCPPB 4379]AZR34380.1 hypothetical protein NX08_007670 [Xanthomonas vasicola]RRJ44751.1 hypothetical protein EIM46_00875 [Xanthomonas vasicola pv. musacearum]